jgi:hypothetical protein
MMFLRVNLHTSRLILAGMAKKPTEPPPPFRWNVYKIASRQTKEVDVEFSRSDRPTIREINGIETG